MNTANHSKDWNSQRSPKNRFSYWINQNSILVITILLGSLLGTYLDLYFTGIGLYSFPSRPMSSVFSINIAFTLVGLPLLTSIFLYVSNKINIWQKAVLILFISLLMAIVEKPAEALGFFNHHESWLHMYSFAGYLLYFIGINIFYRWLK